MKMYDTNGLEADVVKEQVDILIEAGWTMHPVEETEKKSVEETEKKPAGKRSIGGK